MSREIYRQKVELEFDLFEKKTKDYPRALMEILENRYERIKEELEEFSLSRDDEKEIYKGHAKKLREHVREGFFSEINKCFNCNLYLSVDYKTRNRENLCDKLKASIKLTGPVLLTPEEKTALEKGALTCTQYKPVFGESTINEVRKTQEKTQLLLIDLWEQQVLDNL